MISGISELIDMTRKRKVKPTAARHRLQVPVIDSEWNEKGSSSLMSSV
jgi:hypothetical protein